MTSRHDVVTVNHDSVIACHDTRPRRGGRCLGEAAAGGIPPRPRLPPRSSFWHPLRTAAKLPKPSAEASAPVTWPVGDFLVEPQRA